MGLKNPLRRNKKSSKGYSGGISTSSPRARFGNWGGATAPPAIRYGHSDDSNNSTIATNQPSLSKYEQKISSSAYSGSRQNDQFAQPLGLSSPPQPQQVEVGNNEGSSWAVWGQQQGNRGEADTFQQHPQSTANNNRQVSRNSPFTDLAASRHASTDMSRPPRSPGRNGSSGGGYHTNINEQLDPPEEVFNKHRRTNSHGSQALHQQQHGRTGSQYSSSGLSDYGSSTGQSSPGGGGLKAAMQREISRHRTDQGQGQGQGQHVRNSSRGSSQGQGNHSRSNSRGSQGGRVGPSMPILDEGMNRGRTAERQGHSRSRSVGRRGRSQSVGRKAAIGVGALTAVGAGLRGRSRRVGKSQDESTLETASDEQQQQHLHPNSRFHSAEESEIHDSGYFCDAPLVPDTNTERDESTMFGAEESTAFNTEVTGETTTVEDTVAEEEESTEVSYGKSKYDTKKKAAAVATKQHDEEETDFSTDVDDEESFMTRDEDESYIEEEEEVSYDGTYDSSYIDDESYVSEDDRHRRRGSGRRGRRSRGGRRRRPSVDPSTSPGANDNTWASWFGFGGDYEEETVGTPDSAAPDSERSDSVVDPSVDTKANDEQRRNSIVSGETTVVEEEKKSTSNDKEKKKTNNKVAAVASTAAVVTGAATVAAVVSHTHDREGRPLPESKPVRRVPSFKKSWMKSVLPSSGGGAGATYRGAWNENKTVNSEDVTASTVSTSTKGSKTKTTATPKSGIANLGNRLFDVDKRQRDIYCEKHGGVENLIVRQYNDAPMPEDSNHVLVMVEVSREPGSTYDCIYLRFKQYHS